ncbi:MAG: hypothetical protein JNG89_21425, partial [Planctomycetaceae bacterium]|nr:hypothetical protein [Planctomycetaceae bacterium]
MPKLTEEQAMVGLRQIWQDVIGRPKDLEIPNADDNIVDFMRDSRHFDSLDEVDFVIGMHTFFGEKVTDKDVINWFSGEIRDPFAKNFEQWERDIKPTLTFGRLAQWICERASAPSFAPINIAGRNCGPAGAFFGIETTVEELAPGVRFPPRTPILNRLRGNQLELVWNRLNAYASGGLPDLHFRHR